MPIGDIPRYLVAGAARQTLIAAGATSVGPGAATAVRIEAGEPRAGIDVDETTIPQEADLVAGAVSFDKGCYLGQELVARIDSRGRVTRTLRTLVLASSVIPPAGADIVAAGEAAGVLTSAAAGHDGRPPVALALLRTRVRPGDRVEIRWDGGASTATVHPAPLGEGPEDAVVA
jgi:folate-binding protein YgfZ